MQLAIWDKDGDIGRANRFVAPEQLRYRVHAFAPKFIAFGVIQSAASVCGYW